jgi:hypothetical protein
VASIGTFVHGARVDERDVRGKIRRGERERKVKAVSGHPRGTLIARNQIHVLRPRMKGVLIEVVRKSDEPCRRYTESPRDRDSFRPLIAASPWTRLVDSVRVASYRRPLALSPDLLPWREQCHAR